MNYVKLWFTCSWLLVPRNDSSGGYYCWGRISESDALSPRCSDLDLFI